MKNITLLVLMSLTAVSAQRAIPQPVTEGPLTNYIAKVDSSYHWVEHRRSLLNEVSFAELMLTSQRWHDIAWKHQLYIIKPTNVKPNTQHALLFIGGGRWKQEYENPKDGFKLPKKADVFASIAEKLGTPVAILMQVPHQPIFGGKTEDEIIAFTFENYLNTGDPEWPLLLPMVKSAVRAMDAVAEYVDQTWDLQIKSFTVAGASKRGWTSWLTGAVDKRVTAIAPMVIDVLNMGPQLEYQKRVWGDLSYKISDYSERNIFKQLATEAGRTLQEIVDPYNYRHELKQPKLIIIGTNDHYWPLDALNLYWDDLFGPKYILYLAGNRHKLKDYARIIGSINALHQHVASGKVLPQLSWKFTNGDGRLSLKVESDIPPSRIVAWVASSATRDFREAQWAYYPTQNEGNVHFYDLTLPEAGYTAIFGEAVFDDDEDSDIPYFLSTTVKIVKATGADSEVNSIQLGVATK
ncbi:MAG: PhoPQ-activated protein PqaA family protein [Pseudomonadota bacterium]